MNVDFMGGFATGALLGIMSGAAVVACIIGELQNKSFPKTPFARSADEAHQAMVLADSAKSAEFLAAKLKEKGGRRNFGFPPSRKKKP